MTMTRRTFLRSTASATAAASILSTRAFAQQAAAASSNNMINVAIVGVGNQGRKLLDYTVKIAGVKVVAICDIWKNKNLRQATGRVKRHRTNPNPEIRGYVDFGEMLATEKDLDAVIVATPDFWHADHAIACLEAGKHVYCEKEMSRSLENAKRMVEAGAKSDKIFQIGHQRRSNPVYIEAMRAIHEKNLIGRPTYCYAQWNRGIQDYNVLPKNERVRKKLTISEESLKKYGYEDMEQFMNWRWFKKYSSGPIADLGSHQIDIFSWFLKSNPSQVLAMGSTDYFKREWFEDVTCMYDYPVDFNGKKGSARAMYQILNTNKYGGFYERFSGDRGSVTISEKTNMCYYSADDDIYLPDWMSGVEPELRDGTKAYNLLAVLSNLGAEAAAGMKEILDKPTHQFHLENFFNAVRANDKKMLTCPPEEAYLTAVAVLKVIPAIESGGAYNFKADEFKS